MSHIYLGLVASSAAVPPDLLALVDEVAPHALPFAHSRTESWCSAGDTARLRVWSNDCTDRPLIAHWGDQLLVLAGHVLDPRTRRRVDLASDLGVMPLDSGTVTGLGGCFSLLTVHVRNSRLQAWTCVTGVEPIYWVATPDAVLVSNRALLLAMLSARSVRPQYDLEHLAPFLLNGYFASEWTPYRGVRAVGADAALTVNVGGSIRCVPISSDDDSSDPVAPDDDYFDQLAGILTESAQSAAEGSVACQLTGGRDSRLVAAALSSVRRDFVFRTVGRPAHPDVRIAAQISAHLGVPHEVKEPPAVPRGSVGAVLDALLARTSHVLRGSDGMLFGWENVPPNSAPGAETTFGGAGGELLRGGHAMWLSESTASRVRYFVDQQWFATAQYLQEQAVAPFRSWTDAWLEEALRASGPEEALDRMYISFRTARWLAAVRATRHSTPQVEPLLDARLVRQARAVGIRTRVSEWLLFNVMTRLQPKLANMPFAERRWRFEPNGPFDGDVERWNKSEPVRAAEGVGEVDWRRGAVAGVRLAFAEILLDEAHGGTLRDLLRPDRLAALLSTDQPYLEWSKAKMLWGVLSAAVLLRNDWILPPSESARAPIDLRPVGSNGSHPTVTTSPARQAPIRTVQLDRPTENRLASIRNTLDHLRVAMVSQWLPRFDVSAASERVCRIAQILLKAGAEVTYLYWATTGEDTRYGAAMRGARLLRVPHDSQAIARVIGSIAPHVVWLTNVWTPPLLRLLGDVSAQIKASGQPAQLIMDTMDFHAGKARRQAAATGDARVAALAEEFLAAERHGYAQVDRVVVVTEQERQQIQAAFPGVPAIDVVPTIHAVATRVVPFEERRHVAFLGHYGLQQNIDAVRFFVTEILPRIHRSCPDTEFHLLGRDAETLAPELIAAPGVRAIGFVPNLDQALAKYRLFVCPITHGGGMKGKLGAAAGAGLPLVTTTLGAAGFDVEHDVSCFVADDPGEFAEKCCVVYRDRNVWNRLSSNGRRMIAERFGTDAVGGQLVGLLSPFRPHVAGATGVGTERATVPTSAPPKSGRLTAESAVAALIPHYRCEQWLGDCLESLVAQTRRPDAIVVIDDASPVPPVDIVRRFPSVTLLSAAENSGPYRLITEVIRATGFDGYLFQDADDWSSDDRLERLLNEAERTGAELLGTQEVRFYADRTDAVPFQYPLDVNEAHARSPWQYLVLHPSSLVSRDLVMRLGGYASGMRFAGDLEFQHRAVHAARVVNVGQYCYFRRIRQGSLTTAPGTRHGSQAREEVQRILRSRSRLAYAARELGETPALLPYRVAPPVALTHLVGPRLF